MSLQRSLARWVQAGLIDSETAARIAGHEASLHKPVAQYAMGSLGAATLALGLISVVASNWDAIPASVKLGSDLLLLCALAWGVYTTERAQHGFLREILVALLYGGVLASLGLVGQVYQTGTPLYQALLVWSVSTAPLMLLVRTRFVAGLWLSGLASTHGMAFDAWFDVLKLRLGPNSPAVFNTVVCLCFVSPLLYAFVSRVPWLKRARPEVSRVFNDGAWATIFLAGFFAQFIWYTEIRAEETLSWAVFVLLTLALGSAALMPKLYLEWPRKAQYAASGLILLACLSLVFATSFARPALDYVGALLQIGWLFVVAFGLFFAEHRRAFHATTGFIALRVLVVYFEVFGSLLSTGMALISGGILTLGLAWFWRKKSSALTQHMQTGGGHGE